MSILNKTLLSKNKRNQAIEWVLLILLVFGYYGWLSLNTLSSASENSRLLEVFDGDEYNNFNVVHDALIEHTLYIKWEVYGHFYYNLALLPFFVLQRFMPITDTLLICFQRLQSTVFAAATVLVTFGLTRRYFGRTAAWVGSLLLMVMPYEFNYWSVTSHPDTLQMFLLMSGLFFCFEYVSSRKERWLLFSAAFAGLAFATKYAGIFLLPVIWLLSLRMYDRLATPFTLDFFSFQKIRYSIRLLLYTFFVFLVAFAIATPYSLVDLQFIKGIEIQSSFTSAGDIFVTNNNRFEWFEILGSDLLLGNVNLFLLLFALSSFLVKTWSTRGAEAISYKGLLWVWVLIFFAYAFFRVNLRHVRYMLVILPALYILLGVLFSEIVEYVRGRFQVKNIHMLVMLLIAGGCATGMWIGFERQIELIEARQTREINNPIIQAGEWLEANYSPSTRILYDKYSYIPPAFTRVWGTYNMRSSLIDGFRPRVIVINRAIRDIFRDASIAENYVYGSEKFMESHDFYNSMEAQQLGYIMVAEFDGIKIYEKER